MTGPLSVHQCYGITIAVILLSSVVHSLELLAIPRSFIDLVYPDTRRRNKYRYWIALHGLVLVAAATGMVLFALTGMSLPTRAVVVLLALSMLVSSRIRSAGKDGADQVRLLVLLTVSLCFALDDDVGRTAALYFIGFQLLLAYTASGVVKLMSPYWRKGNVLAGILSTYGFGYPAVAEVLKKHPRLERFASHAAIACMLSVLVSFSLPSHVPLMLSLAAMLSFHLLTAILMGLNDFLFTFPAAYPAVLYLHWQVMGS